jgi:hypothetical protein
LDHVRKGALGLPEVDKADHEDDNRHDRRQQDEAHRRSGLARDRPAEPRDHAGDRIQPDERLPAMRDPAERVGDRRGEKPQLDEKRQQKLNVPVTHVHCGEPHAERQGDKKRHQRKNRRESQCGRWSDTVDHHDAAQHHERHREVHHIRARGREWEQEAREVDLADDGSTLHKARRGRGKRSREECPRHDPGEGEDRVWNVVRVDARDSIQEDREDRRQQQGLQDRPQDTQCGLAKAHLQVAPHQEDRELAVFPKLAKLQAREALSGTNDRLYRRHVDGVLRGWRQQAIHPSTAENVR